MLSSFRSLYGRDGFSLAMMSARGTVLRRKSHVLTSQELTQNCTQVERGAGDADAAERGSPLETGLGPGGSPWEFARRDADTDAGRLSASDTQPPVSATFHPVSGIATPGIGPIIAPEHTQGRVINALTIDVEDYFHVTAFSRSIPVADWDRLPHRVVANTQAILELLDEAKTVATFFILGWIAERYPALVRQIAESGHEVASHGYAHRSVGEQSAPEFREDVSRTKRLLEDIAGVEVKGYRAASFSLDSSMRWAYEALAAAGYVYSSSVYPIRHDRYGAPHAPRTPFRPCAGLGIVELPVATVRILNCNFPCAGGGYFRLLPYHISASALRRVNTREHSSCIFYFHPWEIDPGQPRVRACSFPTRARHYVNLGRMRPKLRRLLTDFAWSRLDLLYGLNGRKP